MLITYTPSLFNDGIYRDLRIMKKTECVKYCHPDYSDEEIDGLMRYFRFDTYIDFLDFLKKYKSD